MPDSPETSSLPDDLERFLPPRLWQSLAGASAVGASAAGASAAGEPPRRGLLLNALDRLRSILYLLSTYLPGELVQQKMRRPVAGQVRGEMLDGSLLFSDVSGFTALSERLARTEGDLGAEQLTTLMNDYFAHMLRIIAWSGGCLLKFAGDALLVYFPWQESGQQAAWAVRAALRMMDEMEHARQPLPSMEQSDGGDSAPALRMKVGIGSGSFLAASVGSAERMEYVVLGEPVERTMAAEGLARAGQVIVDGATAARLPDLDLEPLPSAEGSATPPGFFLVPALAAGPGDEGQEQPLDDFEIKVERRRGRGAVPLSASSHAVMAQMEIVLRQIKALVPFLAPELVERIVAGARRRHVAGEFRPTTVLFANLVGVEAILNPDVPQLDLPGRRLRGGAGVSEATRVLDEYFGAMEGIIRRYGGVVSRVDPYRHGSKMLVLFGAPVAHEDDPLRAVSAALAMGDELAALNARWQRRHGRRAARRQGGGREGDAGPAAPHLQHSIGITRGMTFAGEVGSPTRREYTVMGDDVNLAARLMAAGQAGQILISQRVYDAVAEHLAATALPAIRVKGKSRPIPIYQPLGPRGDDPLAHRLQQHRRLVGREAEATAGRQAVRRALAGEGGLLVISGPAGIGKSHLADELATYALARGARLLYAPCRSYHAGAPYRPWISAIRHLADLPADAGPESGRNQLLDRLRAWGLDPAEYGPPLCTFLGLAQPPVPAAVPAAARELATGRPEPAAGGPTLFARLQEKVDQGAGSGGGTKAGLWQLMQQRHQAQPGGLWGSLQARVAARQEERMHCAVCDLLGHAAGQAPLFILLEDAHWLDPASRSLLDDLGRRASSLPLLVLVVGRGAEGLPGAHGQPQVHMALGPLDLAATAALVGHLLEEAGAADRLDPGAIEGIHRQSDGNPLFVEEMVAALLRTDGRQGRASGSLQDLVLSHVDALPTGQREISRVASVAGTDFHRGAVAALLAADLGLEGIDRDLSHLEEQRLILLAEGMPGGEGDTTYLFRQALVRDIVYHSLSLARRQELHAGHAGYLETWPGSSRGLAALLDQAELLAHHYELAGQQQPAAGYLLLSAHKARERYAYGQALAFYGRALAALDELPAVDVAAARSRAAAYQGRGDVALLTGDFRAAVAAYEAACSQPGVEAAPRLEASLALVWPTQGRAADAEALARRLWDGAGRGDPDPDGRLAAAATLAWLLWRRDDAGASDWIERGRALLVASPAGPGPWRAGITALLDDLAGDWPAARRAYLALDRPAGALLAACRQGDRHLADGDVAAALALYEQAAELGTEEKDGHGLALARFRQAEALAHRGDTDAAAETLAGARDLLEVAAVENGGHSNDGSMNSQVIQAARDVLCSGAGAPWPAWRWQAYDDALRISLLFCPEQSLEDLMPAGMRAAGP